MIKDDQEALCLTCPFEVCRFDDGFRRTKHYVTGSPILARQMRSERT